MSRLSCFITLTAFTAGCLLSAVPAVAQEVVHALAGTVQSIDPAAGTISINTDDGSEGLFKDLSKTSGSVDYDKKIVADATPAKTFSKQSTHVIVYYYGEGAMRTAIALQDLGAGPLEKDSGTVLKFDRHHHLLTIRSSAGTEQSFLIAPHSVAETSVGAVGGYQFDPEKGDQVRVTAAPAASGETALFINAS
jgi:hypothetical protein